MTGSILYIILHIFLASTKADKYFEVVFQEGGKWSPEALVEYQGHIPSISEFTTCHWEKLQYFGTRENAIWAYCKINSARDKKLDCIQLYSRGLRATAYRSISYNVWIPGIGANIEIRLDNYRHRTWNHVCWYFSKETGINTLFYNGNLVESKHIKNLPLIQGSLGAHDHSFIIGQEPDTLRGEFDEEQALFGSISELNIWNTSIPSAMIIDMATCKSRHIGNVLAWKKERFRFTNVIVKSMRDIVSFCKSENWFVIFPQRYLISYANDLCSTHGGTMLVPDSREETNTVRDILSKHQNTCSSSASSKKKGEIGVWLGLDKKGPTWFKSTDKNNLSEMTYYNWKETNSIFQSNDARCAFMLGDGSWSAFLKEECEWMQLCVICTVNTNPVLTVRGLCKRGLYLFWNYYISIDGSNQIKNYESYKRGDALSFTQNKWSVQAESDSISLSSLKQYPVGKHE